MSIIKKHFLLYLLIVICTFTMTAGDYREFYYTSNNLKLCYTVLDEKAQTCEVRRLDSYVSSVNGYLTIPSKVADGNKTYTVVSIGNNAFFMCSGLTAVIIPSSIQSIGSSAFGRCSKLNNVYLASGDSGKSIGDYAFAKCENLTTINLPDCVTSIGDYAFSECIQLTSLEIPGSVKSFGTGAFSLCTNLKWMTFNDGLESIGDKSFYGCTNLSISEIPKTVKSIGERAFENCKNLFLMTLHSVTSIGDYAFSRCWHLQKVSLPNSLISIGEGAFYDCSVLSGIILPASVSSIGGYAFYNTAITFARIPDKVTSIGKSAFEGCRHLNTIKIGSSVTSIAENAFLNCMNLAVATIPRSVREIGENAFDGCISLKELTLEDDEEPLELSTSSFMSCPLKTLYVGRNLHYETVKNRPDSPFYGLEALSSLTIGNTVTSIADKSFKDCKGLTKLVLPPSVISIGKESFSGNKTLKTLIMGHRIQEIGEKAFFNCPFSGFYITAQIPPIIYDDTFDYDDVTRSQFSFLIQDNPETFETAYRYWEMDRWDSFLSDRWENSIGLVYEPIGLKIDNQGSLTGLPGTSIQLSATFEPAYVSLPYVFWRSTDPEIASVDSDGLVTIHADLSEAVPADKGDESQPACKIIAETLYYGGPVVEIPVVYSQSSGIPDIADSDNGSDIDPDAPAEVFTLQGIRVSESLDQLSAGIYIVRQGNKVKKIAVR